MKHPPARKPVPPQQVVVQKQNIHVGPLPPPEDLQVYESVLSGLAERIVSMAEAEQQARFRLEDHRHEEAMQESLRRTRFEKRGQIFAIVAVVVLAASALACAIVGAVAVGVALAGVTLAGVVASFLRSRSLS